MTSNYDAAGACTLMGLGPAWASVVAEQLGPADTNEQWSAREVNAARHRLLAGFDDLTLADLRAVARAMHPRRAFRTGRIPPRLPTVALTVAVAISGDDAGWHGRRGHSGRALLTRGLAGKEDHPSATVDAFDALLVGGASRDRIAAALRMSNAATERLAKAASPPRWGYRAVTRQLGWSPDNLRLRRNNDTFPAPDGVDRGKAWWWPDTINRWADLAGLVHSPDCGARVAKLPQHRRVHAHS